MSANSGAFASFPCGLLAQGGARLDAEAGGKEPASEVMVPLPPPQLLQEGREEGQQCLDGSGASAKQPVGGENGSRQEQAEVVEARGEGRDGQWGHFLELQVQRAKLCGPRTRTGSVLLGCLRWALLSARHCTPYTTSFNPTSNASTDDRLGLRGVESMPQLQSHESPGGMLAPVPCSFHRTLYSSQTPRDACGPLKHTDTSFALIQAKSRG